MVNTNIMDHYPKIAIIYLSYHSEPYLSDVISALKITTYPKDKLKFVVVDNPHPEHGSSLSYLRENLLPISQTEIPEVVLLPQEKNLGFGGGNNVGVRWALENNIDYIFFHNNDGFLAANAILPLVRAMQADPEIGIAQSLILLHPETRYINTTGNVFQFLGFGYSDNYKQKVDQVDLTKIKEIGYASGAAMMVSARTIRKFGMWDEDFFMYHEDLEWSFRLRAAGKKIELVPNSIFYHKYQFGRSIEKFYYMERNRVAVMLMFFKLPTLVLLLPMALVLEVGLWIFAWKGGYLGKHIQVYKYWSKKKNRELWLNKRAKIKKIKKVSDKYLLSFSRSGIYFQEAAMKNPLLVYVGNPVMKLYYVVVKFFIVW